MATPRVRWGSRRRPRAECVRWTHRHKPRGACSASQEGCRSRSELANRCRLGYRIPKGRKGDSGLDSRIGGDDRQKERVVSNGPTEPTLLTGGTTTSTKPASFIKSASSIIINKPHQSQHLPHHYYFILLDGLCDLEGNAMVTTCPNSSISKRMEST